MASQSSESVKDDGRGETQGGGHHSTIGAASGTGAEDEDTENEQVHLAIASSLAESTMPMATGYTSMDSGLHSLDLDSMTDEEYQKWLISRQTYRLVRPDSTDLEEIKADFQKAGVRMTQVRKLQNPRLLKKFEYRGFEIQDTKPKGFDLNVQTLYHGTDVKESILCMEGLDDRVAKKGHFGTGIYFSDNPQKCVQYITRRGTSSRDQADRSPEPYILRCRVILGDVKEYPAGAMDLNLNREPVRATTESGIVYYDSVKGMPNKDGLCEYVIYERRSVLIEHIIYYDAKSPPDIQSSTAASDSSCQATTMGPAGPETSRSASLAAAMPQTVASNSVKAQAVRLDPLQAQAVSLNITEQQAVSSNPIASQPVAPCSNSKSSSPDGEALTLEIEAEWKPPRDDVALPVISSPHSSDAQDNVDLAGDSRKDMNEVPDAPQSGNVPTKVQASMHSDMKDTSDVRKENTASGFDMKDYLLNVRSMLMSNTFVDGNNDMNKRLLEQFDNTYKGPVFHANITEEDNLGSENSSVSKVVQSHPSGSNSYDSPVRTSDSTETGRELGLDGDTKTETEETAESTDAGWREELMQSLVKEFQAVATFCDFGTAKSYLELAEMDLEVALNLYLTRDT